MVNPYLDWAGAEGVPVHEDFGFNLHKLALKPWPRFGVNGAIAHLKGRGDFMTVFVFEIPPGGKSESLRHLYEEAVWVLSGHGSTTVALRWLSPRACWKFRYSAPHSAAGRSR